MAVEVMNRVLADRADGGAPTGQWISRFGRGRVATTYRWICLPYAGASGAVYREWPSQLPDGVEVCALELPGRWRRRQEPVFTAIQPLVRAVVDVLQPLLDVPFSVYGHSFGALLAFEVARELRRRGLRAPDVLAAGAHSAPHIPLPVPPLHRLSDRAFLRACADRYDAIDGRLLDDPELCEIMIKPMRGDLTVLEGYEFHSEAPFQFPIWIFGGRTDRSVDDASLRAWAWHSTAPSPLEYLPGGHLFLKESAAALLARMGAVTAARSSS